MNNNALEKYELIHGTAIIDNDFSIITANESMFQFIGITTNCTLVDVIHQVDLDDFVNVVNSLRGEVEKTMVLRMRRVDNSYRWMMVKMRKCINGNPEDSKEYLKIVVSDILALEKYNDELKRDLKDYQCMMALEGEVLFNYDCETHFITLYYFVDDEQKIVTNVNIDEFVETSIQNGYICEDDINEIYQLKDDIVNGKMNFIHAYRSNLFNPEREYQLLEVKGSTVYHHLVKKRVVGSVRNLTDTSISYTKNTYTHTQHSELLTVEEVDLYALKNLEINSSNNIALILLEIDNYNTIVKQKGIEYTKELFDTVATTTKSMVGFRGVVGRYNECILYIAMKGLDIDNNLRAFIESLRHSISWDYAFDKGGEHLTFSIGIARNPYNGSNYDITKKKVQRALEIANEKGHNRYIIYRENLHGEIIS